MVPKNKRVGSKKMLKRSYTSEHSKQAKAKRDTDDLNIQVRAA